VFSSRNAPVHLLAAGLGSGDACRVSVAGFAGPSARPLASRDRRARAYPSWARWDGALDRRYTVGLEEQVMLLHPDRWSLAQSSDTVLARLPAQLSARASAETHASVIELVTGLHTDVNDAVRELASLRRRLQRELAEMGLTAAAAGTHPLTLGSETRASAAAGDRLLVDSMRVLARREPTMAMRVHVGIPTPAEAIRVLDGLRRSMPILLALSANSPFWQGRDGGFASSRMLLSRAFPRTGVPRHFGSYDDYVDALAGLMVSDAVADTNSISWDVRLQPALGTVEVRVMDAQTTVREARPLLALVQALARLELEGDRSPTTPCPEVLEENRCLAARDGMAARLIDAAGGALIPARELLDVLLAECRPHALALGCGEALERVQRLAAANGADRQRAFAQGDSNSERLVESLAERFLAPAWPTRSTAPEHTHG